MSYATQKQIEAILGRCLTDSEVILLPGVNASVDAWLNNQVGSLFSSETGTRIYDGGSHVVDIDPVKDISSVVLINTAGDTVFTYSGEDYIVGPYNSDYKTYIEKNFYENAPYIDWLYDVPCWPNGYRVAVTGEFGLGDVPENISYLAGYLASKLYSGSAFSIAGIAEESIEGYRRRYGDVSGALDGLYQSDPIVQFILDPYTGSEIFF